MLRTDNLLRNRQIMSMHRRAAGLKRLFMTIQINSLSSWAMVRLLPISNLDWCGWPMSRVHRQILLTNPCNTAFRPPLAENSPQPKILQYTPGWAFKITWHDALKELWKMQNDLARNTHNIESSVSLADFAQSGSYLDDFHSSQSRCCTVLLPLV